MVMLSPLPHEDPVKEFTSVRLFVVSWLWCERSKCFSVDRAECSCVHIAYGSTATSAQVVTKHRTVRSATLKMLWRTAKSVSQEKTMSTQDVRHKIQKLSAAYPRDFRIIRSAQEVDRIDLANAEMHGPFDNGSSKLGQPLKAHFHRVTSRHTSRGSDQVLVFTPQPGQNRLEY